MPVTPLVVAQDNVDDITSASIFNEMQKPVNTLNEHMVGTTGNGATRHTDLMIDATGLPETTAPTQSPGTQHVYNDGTYAALSSFLGAFTGTGAIAKLAAAAAQKTYFAALALLASHSHADATTGGQLLQANTHQSADTDVSAASLHHTLGTGAFQAAAGNHTHTGYEQLANKGVASGYASLDSGGHVPDGQISGTWATATSVAAKSPVAHTHTAAGESQIPTAGIQDLAVTTAKLADGAVAATKIPAGSITQDKLSDLYTAPAVSTDGTGWQLKVRVNPGEPWNGGAKVSYGGGLSPAIDPTGIGVGSSRIDLLVINAAGNLAWVLGTPGTTPAKPALGAAQIPVRFYRVYSGATSITATDTGANAYPYEEGRAVFLNPTGQGAATSAAPISATYITDADETASLASAKRLGRVLANDQTISSPNGTLGGAALIRTGPTDASILDLAAGVPQPLFGGLSSLLSVAGTAVQLAATGNPVTVLIGGSIRRTSVVITSNVAAGGAGRRYLYADTAGAAAATFVLTLGTNSAPLATQYLLASYLWTGSALVDLPQPVDFSPLGLVQASQLRPFQAMQQANPNLSIPSTAYVYPVPSTAVYTGKPGMVAAVSGAALFYNNSIAGAVYQAVLQVYPPGGPWTNVSEVYNFQPSATNLQATIAIPPVIYTITSADLWYFTIACSVTIGTATVATGHCTIQVTG
jgi:hypothetical protein